MQTRTDKFIQLNTVFIPDGGLLERAVEFAAKIVKGKKIYFCVDNKKYFVHLTVYAPEYPKKNLEKVIEIVVETTKKIKPLTLTFEKFYTRDGWLGFEFRRTKEIVNAHKILLKRLNSLREGRIKERYITEMAAGRCSPRQVKYIEQYGYRNILDDYHPHLTLTRFEDFSEAERIADRLNTKKINFNESLVDKIGVAISGEHGTCTKIIQEFKLRE